MGEVELKDDRIVVRAHIILYGSAASALLASDMAFAIQRHWNEPQAMLNINELTLPLKFEIWGSYQPALTDLEVISNLDVRKNYFRVEFFSSQHISYVDGIGCNTGYFKYDNLLNGSTTAAHEFGHTLGLVHPKVLDIRGKGVPGIMYPRGTITDPAFQYDPAVKPLEPGGTLNPFKRKVLIEDIDMLHIDRLKFKNNKAILGEFSSVYHQPEAEK